MGQSAVSSLSPLFDALGLPGFIWRSRYSPKERSFTLVQINLMMPNYSYRSARAFVVPSLP
jgi:hypothetical protein